MPYTPPSQLSPTVSKTPTPTPSRSSSYLHNGNMHLAPSPATSDRPYLPRSSGSATYLNKHRRSPSTSTTDAQEAMTDSQRGISFDPHGSLRQSPPPRTNGIIPSGMTISPPESSHNSDDEDVRGRSRELERENLAELQAAIRNIHQQKPGSPVRKPESILRVNTTSEKPHINGTSTPEHESNRPPLSSSQRKITHSRSNTDSDIAFDSPPKPQSGLLTPRFATDSDESDSEDGPPTSRPPMVRKKSGELVRPALRAASRRRPSSMPGTPTYSKAVHFDSHLEHVRHFLQVDRPLAVSAGSSPVEAYESENEFPFGSDESSARSRGTAYEWEIRLANFPSESEDRRHMPIHVERIFLSSDNKNLVGSIAVQNLSFQKFVVARFTLDYWKTTSEVAAEFNNDVRRKGTHDGLDRFTFTIKLADQANLENKTLFFCVRYNVNGQEYWDSNNSCNYQVDFTKQPKAKPAVSAPGLGARPLPRSRPSPPTSSGRPKSMPISFDDFASGFENFGSAFGQAPGAMIGEPKIRLRSPKSKGELVPDAPARRHKSSSPMFGHRYDFNSSLTAAKNSAVAVLGEQSGLSPVMGSKQTYRDVPAVAARQTSFQVSRMLENDQRSVSADSLTSLARGAPMTSKPAALMSEKPPLTSQSYQELVDKYCFFGSARSPPPLTTANLTMVDGANDDQSVSDLSVGSPQSSGTSTPTAGGQSPSPPSELSSVKAFSTHISRSTSPLPYIGSCLSSRSASPISFGYPYHHSQNYLTEAPSVSTTCV